MISRIAEVIAEFKREWTSELEPESIRALCLELGHRWRERMFDPAATIHLFLLQIVHGNTAISHLRHLANRSFSATAYCNARGRVPVEVFERLLERIAQRLHQEEFSEQGWKGHRTFISDGSSFSMPDTDELQEQFGQPPAQRQGCGFPVAHVLTLFDAASGMILKAIPDSWRSHDMHQVAQLHPELKEGDLLLADRAFCSFS